MAPLKWGIVGTGFQAHDFVNSILSKPTEDHQIVGVASRKLETAKEFAMRFGIPKYYGSCEELTRDAEVDVVYAAVLSFAHMEVGKKILEGGKHLLMETPMTTSQRHTKELVETARLNGRFLMEGLSNRFFPIHQYVTRRIREGCIGDVVHVSFQCYNDPSAMEVFMNKPMQTDISDDGPPLPIALFNLIFGVQGPENVAAVRHSRSDNGMSSAIVCSLTYSNNRTATMLYNMAVYRPDEVAIYGTSGQIKLLGFSLYPIRVEMPDKVYDFPAPETREPLNYGNISLVQHEADAVKECLSKGLLEHPDLPLAESIAIVGASDQIHRQLGVPFPE